MSKETKDLLNLAIGTFFTVAIGGNAYFVKRLVDKIDETSRIAIETRAEVQFLKSRIPNCRRAESDGGNEDDVESLGG